MARTNYTVIHVPIFLCQFLFLDGAAIVHYTITNTHYQSDYPHLKLLLTRKTGTISGFAVVCWCFICTEIRKQIQYQKNRMRCVFDDI